MSFGEELTLTGPHDGFVIVPFADNDFGVQGKEPNKRIRRLLWEISRVRLYMIVSALLAIVPMRVMIGPLADSVRSVDRILVGRVERIVVIDGHRFADVAVERTIKGKPSVRVRFVAEPTWACDTSSAVAGERGVFLFSRLLNRNDRTKDNRAFGETLQAAGPCYLLDHAGSGRILIQYGKVKATAWENDYVVGLYSLPKKWRPGRQVGNQAWFAEDKFASGIAELMGKKSS